MSLRLVRGQQGDFASASLDLAAQTLLLTAAKSQNLRLSPKRRSAPRMVIVDSSCTIAFEGINQINDAHLLRAVRLAKRF